MNPPKPMSHPRLIGELLVLGILTSIAFAITGGVASSVARAAPPPQCPTGTILNLQTHACVPVKPPAAAAPAAKPAAIAGPAPTAVNSLTKTATCTLPPSENCPPTAASCLYQTACCTTSQGTQKCESVLTSKAASCLQGYFGPSCQSCPGGASNPCSGNGTCGQGITGTGTCTCYTGFTGPACQTKAPQ